MSKRLLRVGDIFLIEKGQTLYTKDHGRVNEEVLAGESSEHQEYKTVKGKSANQVHRLKRK